MAGALRTTIEGSLRYRGKEGQLAYLGHRISGLGTLLFLSFHILDTSVVYFFPDLYQHAINLYRSSAVMLLEMLLVVAVIAHGVNGLRLALLDFYPNLWDGAQKKNWFYAEAVITVVLGGPAVFLMGRSLYLHNICQCAPEDTSSLLLPTWARIAIVASLVIALLVLIGTGTMRKRAEGPKRTFESWMWLFMRWSAVLLIPLVWVHILLNDVLFGVHRIDLSYVQLRWASLGWRLFDAALLAFAFGHGMNGLRNVLHDYMKEPKRIRIADRVILVLYLTITAIGSVALIGGVRAA